MKLVNKSGSVALATALALSISASPLIAATATTSMAVSANVADNCNVVATPLAFGALSSSATTNEIAPAVISVICTSSKAIAVALNGGGNLLSGARRMTDGTSNFVAYSVYSDSGHSSAVAVNGNIYSGTIPAVVPHNINVYGTVAAGSYAFGNYTDSILITVTY